MRNFHGIFTIPLPEELIPLVRGIDETTIDFQLIQEALYDFLREKERVSGAVLLMDERHVLQVTPVPGFHESGAVTRHTFATLPERTEENRLSRSCFMASQNAEVVAIKASGGLHPLFYLTALATVSLPD